MALTQTTVLTTLAYLMGERTVNSTTSTPRADFIQRTLEEIYRAYPWRFAQATATIAVNSGVATLPTNVDLNHSIRATFFASPTTEVDLNEVDYADKYLLADGNRAFWLHSNGDGSFLLKTKDSDINQVVVRYQTPAPVLDSAGTTTTPYPSDITLALGARRYVKLSQNPDADISQDEKFFEKQLANDIAAQQVPAPRRQRRSIQQAAGSRTGDF